MRQRQSLLLLSAIFVTTLLFVIPDINNAQEISEQLADFNNQRIDLNQKGMYVLSGWALTNIAVGSIGYFNSSGTTKYLHQMNAGWNLVNLAIAGGALWQYGQADPTAFSLAESVSEAQSIEKMLMLNIGLNVSYIAGGGYLWERGINKSSDRLIGYGQSLLIQGGFLLLFDSTLYWLNRSNNSQIQSILEHVTVSGTQLSLSIPL
jgi:hypothetical protein